MRFVFVCAPLSNPYVNFGGIFDLARMAAELEEFEAQMGQPNFWNDSRAAASIT